MQATHAYDAEANKTKTREKHKAAERIYGLLPEDQEIRWISGSSSKRMRHRKRAALSVDISAAAFKSW